MDTKRLVIGLGVILLIIVGFFLVVRGDADYMDEGTFDQTANTYVSDDYNFSFERPAGYDVLEVTDPASKRHSIVLSEEQEGGVPENGEGPPAITVDIFENVREGSAEAWVRANQISNFQLATGGLNDTTVDGEDAVRYSWDGLYRGRSVAFMHEGSLILISGTYLEQSDPIYADFDEVVSSVKLR